MARAIRRCASCVVTDWVLDGDYRPWNDCSRGIRDYSIDGTGVGLGAEEWKI